MTGARRLLILVVLGASACASAPPEPAVAPDVTVAYSPPARRAATNAVTPVKVGVFPAERATCFTKGDGLPSDDVQDVVLGEDGAVYARTAAGAARFGGSVWASVPDSEVPAAAEVEEAVLRRYAATDGLPVGDLTTYAQGEAGVVWLGSTRGAIRYDGKIWEYRQGRRWLPHDHVRAIAVDPKTGEAWFATPAGVGRIQRHPMTLAKKARFFEDEIDRRHRRTEYGYVTGVRLRRPGDLSTFVQVDSDNDGLWTAMLGAGECFAWAATRDPQARARAKAGFEALRFLTTVTQGGSHPAQPGFPARTVLPTSGRDPSAFYTLEKDRKKRAERDGLWKIMHPRWPRSADGKWYWKCDTSSDELDGHYFLYAQYYDLVADTEEEKARVRETVAAITDHLLRNDFRLIDWDGKPTRWANFSPASLNHDPDWWEERGLNSLSILSYLKVAEHICGDPRYRDAADRLIRDHGYLMNVMQPKAQQGPGTGNQSDDEMAFMAFYNLLLYEDDPTRRAVYAFAFRRYWDLERPERNPLFNVMFAGSCWGESFSTPWGTEDLTPDGAWLEESLDTLRRFPLDRVQWAQTNSLRRDVVPLGGDPKRGHLRDGRVLPIDERFVEHWNTDVWRLDTGGDGRRLASGAAFLLPYYMGRYHGFIAAD